MIHTRRAGPLDAAPMADLLNDVIAQGGTTALTSPVDRTRMLEWMERDPHSVWHVAEDDAGQLLGFQWVDQLDPSHADRGHIATFARIGRTGLGIGSALWSATREAAAEAGFKVIEADIRADNTGGLAYYQSRGFEDLARREAVRLDDGTVVDKIIKIFRL